VTELLVKVYSLKLLPEYKEFMMNMRVQQDKKQIKKPDSKKGQYIKIGGQKGYSLLQGLLILIIISVVLTIVLSYFS
jgi:hypothetical protein